MSTNVPDAAPTLEAAPSADPVRDSVLAELAAGAHQAKPAAPVEAAKTEPVKDEPPAEEEDDDEDTEPAPEQAAQPKPDPETERKLASIQKEQKAAAVAKQEAQAERKRLAEERAAWEAKQGESATEVELAKKILGRLKRDPAGAFRDLGIEPERFEEIAREFYANSPKGAEKPEYREQSARALREREHRDELTSLRDEVTTFKKAQEERFARLQAEQQAERHMTQVFEEARAAADAPLLAAAFAKNAKKAEAKLAGIALALAEANGELPDAADIIVEYNKRRTEEIEDLGLTVDEYLRQQSQAKTATTPGKQDKAAGEKRPARTLNNDLSASTQVRQKVDLSPEEERDRDLAELAKLTASGGLVSAVG